MVFLPVTIKKMGLLAMPASAIPPIVKRSIGAGIYAGAKDMAKMSRRLAPRGKTGDLKASIKAHKISWKRSEVRASVPYAKYMEEGFIHYKSGEFIRRPFLQPAFAIRFPTMRRLVHEKFRNVLLRLAGWGR